jgi:hypothetical protein
MYKHYHQFMKYFSGYMTQGSQQANPRWDFSPTTPARPGLRGSRPQHPAAGHRTTVGITERAAPRIVFELVDEGYVLRERQGRRNHYQVKARLPLRHPLAEQLEVGDLLGVLIA